MIKKVLACASFAVLSICAVIDRLPARHSPVGHLWPLWLVQFVLIIAVIISYRRFLHVYFVNNVKAKPPRTMADIHKVPREEAHRLQAVAGRIPLTAKQVLVFSLALLEPAELRQRVNEHYTPGQRTLTQSVTVEVKIPNRLLALKASPERATGQLDAGALLFPVLTVPKGTLHDNLEVYDADHELVPTLNYREYLQLVAGILRLFLSLAYGLQQNDDHPRFPQPSSRLQDVLLLENLALRQIIKRTQANNDLTLPLGVSPVAPEATYVAKLIERLPVKDDNRVYLKFAADLIRKLSRHYAQVASIPEPLSGRTVIVYKRSLIPELELSPSGVDESPGKFRQAYLHLTGWLRVLFGTRPVSVTVSLDNAWTCESYHVRVDAPEGLYLGKQQFVASAEYRGNTNPPVLAKGAPTPLHYRFRRRLGQPYGQFYGRFFPLPIANQRRPKIQFDFFEVPPSSDFRAAIASTACLGLVWLVGFVMSRTRSPGTDAPAFLLVFPGVAASWLGFDAPSHRLFEGKLAARLSLGLTAVLSVGASGLFMFNRAGFPSFLFQSLPFNGSVLGVSNAFWAVFVIVSLLNTLYLTYRWLRNSMHFKYLAQRQDPDWQS